MKDSTTKGNHKTQNFKIKIISASMLLILWWLLAWVIGKSYIVPSPPEVFTALVVLVKAPAFYMTIMKTLMRTLFCIFLSMFGGIFMAVLAGIIPALRAVFSPWVHIMRTLPTIVVIVYVIIWMSSLVAPVFVTMLITMPIVYSNVLTGYDETPKELIEMSMIYRFPLVKRLKYIYFPAMKPYIKAGLFAITALSLKVIIASEVLSQTQGSVGKAFQVAKINLQTEQVFAWAIITILLSLSLETIMKRIVK